MKEEWKVVGEEKYCWGKGEKKVKGERREKSQVTTNLPEKSRNSAKVQSESCQKGGGNGGGREV